MIHNTKAVIGIASCLFLWTADLQSTVLCISVCYMHMSLHPIVIQAHYHSVTGALTTAQQEITQYLANTEQLNSQITNLQSQVAAVVSEREGAFQQATHLSATIQDLEQKVQALEAQKDQLEEDRFTAQTALQDLQAQHEQVRNYYRICRKGYISLVYIYLDVISP